MGRNAPFSNESCGFIMVMLQSIVLEFHFFCDVDQWRAFSMTQFHLCEFGHLKEIEMCH